MEPRLPVLQRAGRTLRIAESGKSASRLNGSPSFTSAQLPLPPAAAHQH
jgi:hypothetical protein